MAGEGADLATDGVRAALEMTASASTSGFFVSVKIDSPILAGVALAGALSLGAFYLSKRHSVENAIRNGLEERNENGADPEVRNIGDGSILVELYCHTDRSLLQFVDDLEAEKVKHRLQEKFCNIGFNRELVVTIRNAKEVYKKVQEIRCYPRRASDTEAPHEIKLKVVPQNLDVKKQDTSSHQFSADINMFLKQNTLSPTEGLNALLKGLEDTYNLSIQALKFEGLEIRVECVTLGSLERLWRYFLSRRLNEIAEMCILTDEVKKKLNLKNMRLTTFIKEEDYETCRRSFIERVKPSSVGKSQGAVMELREIIVKITTHNADGENLKESNQNFGADLEIGLECTTAQGLECLWTDFESGYLTETAERCLLTDEVTENPQMKDVKVKTVIKDGEYFACRKSFFEPTKPTKGVASPGNVTESHEMSVKITSHNVDAVKKEKLNQYFQQEVKNYNAFFQTEGLADFLGRFRNKCNVRIKEVGLGSLEIRVECPTLESLENLKSDYCSGYLDEMAEKCMLTDDVRQKLNLKDVSLKVVIRQEDYDRCRKSFLGPVRQSSEVINPENIPSYHTDYSKSQAKGNGLKEAEQGAEANFTITTRDSEGKPFYSKQEHVTVTIRSRTGKEEVKTIDLKDGNYTVYYKPKSAGRHDVTIVINGWPLTGSPWRVNVKPYQYKVVKSCGSSGNGEGEFHLPRSIAKNEKTGEIIVADTLNGRLQVFDENLKYLRTIGGETGLPTGAALKIHEPGSVAVARNGDTIVIDNDGPSRQMLLITDDGQFIQKFTKHVITPRTVFVTNDDGHVIVCNDVDGKIKVLSSDGAQLLQSFSVPPEKFFVLYSTADCVKVFNKEGLFLFNIGSKGSGEGQFLCPCGLVVDAFDNLIVCDNGNRRLQMFTLDGEFLCSFDQENRKPWAITVCKNGDLLVTDTLHNCVLILR
ncbi:hypothetical protein pdam_00021877 [Pocillopora damicornis]|uniref:E3 ubiquitin-protein ligase TRIM71 n=1 Tax=Pocillopora damicornis TaxID=46731 RepID=A0A3M6UYV5_POCDA|nr:hypothetical protein pdam_00021877 [Pocillopora damicornis]